ncbi:glycosyltransferase [Streptomyces sp. DH10]|uniref:glycosyltransferase n=1 Tax=Streptomyces sp. DH10 TaxID=3040121 RepID=UPI0024429CDE|nr:glycosyltransferase [Streptomyces sp. DH10]MDG9708627.1 glycosyltransferase [Streptomyces sp. DH10]
MGKRSPLTMAQWAPHAADETRRPGEVPAVPPARRRMTALQWAARAALPVALVVWLLSLRHVNLNAMTDLGLLQVLPVLFWIALGLLVLGFCVALSDRRTRGGWLAAYVLGLIAILHATPALLYPTLRYGWAWKHVAVVDAMIRNGGSVPGANKLDVYDQWPGFFHLNALVVQATGLESSLGYAVWAPPLNNVLLLAPLLLIYRAVTTDRRLVWGAVWIFYSCSWVGQDYFAPQAFAFLLFVTLIALVMGQLRAWAERSPGSQGRAWPVGRYLLAVLIMAVVVCSHPLTPLMMLSALVALSLPRRNRRVLLPVLGAGALLTLVWDATVARPFVAANLSEFVGALLEPDSNVVSGLAALGAAAPGQVVVSWVDRGLSAAVFLLAALAFVMRRWTRRTGMPLLVLAPMPVLVANSYGGEMIFRAYLFALPAAALLISALLFESRRRPRLRVFVVAPLLLAMLGGLLFGYYGKEAANHFTHDEVAATHFVTATTPPGSLIVSLTSDVPGLEMNYDRHPRIQLNEQEVAVRQRLVNDPIEGLKPFIDGATVREPAYIVLSRAQAAECYLNGTLPADTMQRMDTAMANTWGFVQVFRNKDGVVYRYQNPDAREAS